MNTQPEQHDLSSSRYLPSGSAACRCQPAPDLRRRDNARLARVASPAALAALLIWGAGGACAAPYQQDTSSTGIVSIELEDYDRKVAQGGQSWVQAFPDGHSGGGALEASPNSGANNNSGYVAKSPQVDYRVLFTKSGPHYVWVRAVGASSEDDSLHLGLDGVAYATSSRIGNFPRQLGWHNTLMDGAVALIDVPTPGEHVVNVWMREDGVVIDKLVLTSSSSYVPKGLGPAASPRESVATVGSSLPVDLRGKTPEQASIQRSVSKPSNAQLATVTLSTFDADNPAEGELVINGNPPIALFGSQGLAANDDQSKAITLETPAAYWRDGSNTLVFTHNSTAGYTIDGLKVAFSGGSSTADTSGDAGAVVESGNAQLVQVNLQGATPEQSTLTLALVKPSSASAAVLTMETFDADNVDEGELIINGNPPVALFGSAARSANDGNAATVSLTTPATYWRDGNNNLVFRHTRTGGYIVDRVAVAFASSATAAPVNQPPTLSGSPPKSVVAGSRYTFQPTAGDADGDRLVFSVANKPSWASFSTSTGHLEGVPGDADVGSYTNIRIAVNDGSATATLSSFSVTVSPASQSSESSGSTETTATNGAPVSVVLRGTAPEQKSVTLQVSKPAGASTAVLILQAFDPDTANEGELIINGNAPIALFGSAAIAANDGKTATVSLPTPVSYWQTGANTLLFRHTRTGGFSIDHVSVAFSSAATAATGSVGLSWSVPVLREDGSQLGAAEIAGYTVYYGTSPGSYPYSRYVAGGYNTSTSLGGLYLGQTYYLVMTCRDTAGVESDPSAVVNFTMQ